MIPFIAGVVAGGAALLYWISSSDKDAKTKAQEQCMGCVQAAKENRLNDIVQYVDQPCRECLDAVEQYSSDPINRLTTIGNLSSASTAESGATQYDCYHRNDPSQVYHSQVPIDCRSLFGGAGISPGDAKVQGDDLRKAREIIRIKGNRAPLSGVLSGI